MSISTKRLNGSRKEPFTLEVVPYLSAVSPLLWHLASRLPGLQVVAKKSSAFTDDFEAYFLYKGRLFVVETPFSKIWVSLLGQPADELLFSEVESQVKSYGFLASASVLIAWIRYAFLPAHPPSTLLAQHDALPSNEPDAT